MLIQASIGSEKFKLNFMLCVIANKYLIVSHHAEISCRESAATIVSDKHRKTFQFSVSGSTDTSKTAKTFLIYYSPTSECSVVQSYSHFHNVYIYTTI
jgi:hypothetical protein